MPHAPPPPLRHEWKRALLRAPPNPTAVLAATYAFDIGARITWSSTPSQDSPPRAGDHLTIYLAIHTAAVSATRSDSCMSKSYTRPRQRSRGRSSLLNKYSSIYRALASLGGIGIRSQVLAEYRVRYSDTPPLHHLYSHLHSPSAHDVIEIVQLYFISTSSLQALTRSNIIQPEIPLARNQTIVS